MDSEKIARTVATLAAGFVVTKLIDQAWRRATGHAPPVADDQDVNLRQIFLYAAITGGLAALARAGAARAATKWVAPKGSLPKGEAAA